MTISVTDHVEDYQVFRKPKIKAVAARDIDIEHASRDVSALWPGVVLVGDPDRRGECPNTWEFWLRAHYLNGYVFYHVWLIEGWRYQRAEVCQRLRRRAADKSIFKIELVYVIMPAEDRSDNAGQRFGEAYKEGSGDAETVGEMVFSGRRAGGRRGSE